MAESGRFGQGGATKFDGIGCGIASKWTAEQLQLAERECRVFFLADASGATYYPAFFCDPDLIDATELVSRRLGKISGFQKWIFFSDTMYRLGDRTPIETLEAGDLDSVLQAADYLVSKLRPRGAAASCRQSE